MAFSVTDQEWNSIPEHIREVFTKFGTMYREHLRCNPNPERYAESLLFGRGEKPRNTNQVIFVSDIPSTRVVKLGAALKRRGLEVGLLFQESHYGDLSRFFSFCDQYDGAAAALIKAASYNPLCYHAFSSWDFLTATRLIIHRPGPVLFDNYDVLSNTLQWGFVESKAQKIAELYLGERFCFAKADGLVCRHTILRTLRREGKQNFVVQPRKIFFPEYCWGPALPAASSLREKRKDGVHAVYVGSISAEKFYSPQIVNCYDRMFIESLTSKGIHFHIYPSPVLGKNSKEAHPWLAEYAASNPLCHLHESLPCDDLIAEISQYHFGVFAIPETTLASGDDVYQANYIQASMPNKVFDYLDAELPVVLQCGRILNWFVDRLGAAVLCPSSSVGEVLAAPEMMQRYPEILRATRRAKEVYSVERQARRLVSFYQEVAFGRSYAQPRVNRKDPALLTSDDQALALL